MQHRAALISCQLRKIMDLYLSLKKRIRYRHVQEKKLSHFENFDFFEKIVRKLFLTYDMKDDVHIEPETTEYTDSDHLESQRYR